MARTKNLYVTWDEMKKIGELHRKQMEQVQEALNRRLLWRGSWKAGENYHLNDMTQDRSAIPRDLSSTR